MGTMVEFSGNGKPYSGYLAPSVSGAGPGVIVIQEWWGLVGHIKDVVDRFAQAGFTALAPDFYHGATTTEPDVAGSLMMALDIANAAKVIHGAVDALLSSPATEGDKIGVVGFCMGGQLSMYAACIDDRIGACVNFYGIHPNVKPDFTRLMAPMLGFFAESDDYASAEVVSGLDQELSRHGKPHEFMTFPGTSHAFFNSDRPAVFDADASEHCWQKMTSFFRGSLAESG
ncbi:MAG: dienelactone hydrolase family protein [Armatimonadetes bacterium]|nr:dienelactone hydrolase family protein [Armatimonadota bacterium]